MMNNKGIILDGQLTVGSFIIDDNYLIKASVLFNYVDIGRGKTLGDLSFMILSKPNVYMGDGNITAESCWCGVDYIQMIKAKINVSGYEN